MSRRNGELRSLGLMAKIGRNGTLTGENALLAIAGLAFVQIVVHLIFFLHMNASSAQRLNVMAFGFTVLTAVILIVGSLWIMHNVSMHMMSR